MLDLKYIRNNINAIKTMLKNRNNDLDISVFEAIDAKRRDNLAELESLRFKRNKVSEDVAVMKKRGEDATSLISDMKEVSARIKDLETELGEIEEKLNQLVMIIPNVPHDSVPVGSGEKDNPVVRTWGHIPEFDFEPLAHWDIGEKLNILDFNRAAKLAGARFALYRGAGSRLERALINFMLDLHTTEHGYIEILPPFMVNAESMTGTGQLPKFKEDLFKIEGWIIT
jgi:seryl-tRNA synthetase